jgi:hypothetical protein
LAAFTGITSAANADDDNATAATTDKTTFFIDPAPFFVRTTQNAWNEISIGASAGQEEKASNLLPF